MAIDRVGRIELRDAVHHSEIYGNDTPIAQFHVWLHFRKSEYAAELIVDLFRPFSRQRYLGNPSILKNSQF